MKVGRPALARWAAVVWQASGTSLFHRTASGEWAAEGEVDAAPINAVLEVSPIEQWAVGRDGFIRWNGASFAPMTAQPPFASLDCVWASSAADVWVGGFSGVQRWNGSSWSVAGNTNSVRALWGSGGEVFAARGIVAPSTSANGEALRWTGSSWAALAAPNVAYWGVSGRSPTEVYSVGDQGAIVEWDGVTATPLASPLVNALTAVGGTWGGDRHGQLYRWSSKGSASLAELAGTSFGDGVAGVFGLSQSNIWAVGSSGVPRQWDGTRRRAHDVHGQYVTSDPMSAIWGAAPDALWAVGTGAIAHWNGSFWSKSAAPVAGTLRAVWGTGPTDVWAVGEVLMHFDGGSWSTVDAGLGDSRLVSVWAAAKNDYWAVGESLYRFDGARWRTHALPAGKPISVWGRSATEVYVFTREGDAFQWNGVRFTRTRTGAPTPVTRAWGDDAGVRAIGGRQIFVHP